MLWRLLYGRMTSSLFLLRMASGEMPSHLQRVCLQHRFYIAKKHCRAEKSSQQQRTAASPGASLSGSLYTALLLCAAGSDAPALATIPSKALHGAGMW